MTNRNMLDDVDEDNVFVERREPGCWECVLRAMGTTDCKLVGELGVRSDFIHLGRAAAGEHAMYTRRRGNVRCCDVTHRVTTYRVRKLLDCSGAMREVADTSKILCLDDVHG